MIQTVQLSNFRNLIKRDFSFSPSVTVIVGANGVGKTNILESVFLLATGKSFKAKVEEEMLNYDADIGRIKGNIEKSKIQITNDREATKSNETSLEIVLTRGEVHLSETQIQKAPRKKMLVNGVPRRLIDFAGNFSVVLFAPSDMDLVTESPSIRRRFLDTVLSQTDREYRRSLLSYEKGLRQRNRILFNIRENGAPRSQLLFWNHLLIKNGDYISKKREEFIEYTNLRESLSENQYQLEYDKSAISEGRLEQYKVEEVASATTLVGQHLDDIVFKISAKGGSSSGGQNNKLQTRELGRYGSRGEQRMGVLWLKLAELSYIESVLGETPTLLLDDIFSELDHMHRDVVMEVVHTTQTIMTTADPHYVEGIKDARIIELT